MRTLAEERRHLDELGANGGGVLHELRCHPATPASRVRSIVADWNDAALTFRVDPVDFLLIPESKPPARTDELWRTTCFELFWKPVGSDGYVELNLSPSSCWAAYAFDGYRQGMRDLILPHDPIVERTTSGIRAALDLSELRRPAHVALTAVIEETDGTKSYWSLAHPPGAPDFHHPDCFALKVPAVGNP